MKRQNGMTLIEIMISLLLGIMVVGGALSIYISSIRSSADVTRSARLNYDLDSVLSLMVNDIRRAGYWGGAVAGSNARNNSNCTQGNPFTCGSANIIIGNKTGESANSCILYTYDVDDGDNDTPEVPDGNINVNEFFGFRLNGTSIDMRYTIDDINVDCTTVNCCDSKASDGSNLGAWESIVETNQLAIDGLNFSMANSKCLNNSTLVSADSLCATATSPFSASSGDTLIETRQIDISLSGSVADEDSVTKALSSIIKIRNDRIFTQPSP